MKTFKLKLIKDILLADPNVNDVDVQDESVVFHTKDTPGDNCFDRVQEYDWDNFIGLSPETLIKLKELGATEMWNDCEGCENEGQIYYD